MKRTFLKVFVLAALVSPAMADEISFSDFTKLKDAAVNAGKMIGGLQACSDASGGSSSNTFHLLANQRISDFREILEATKISRSDMLIIDDAMTAEASRIRSSSNSWADQVSRVQLPTNECSIGFRKNNACCSIELYAGFAEGYAKGANWENDKSPENAIKLMSQWGGFWVGFVGVSPIE